MMTHFKYITLCLLLPLAAHAEHLFEAGFRAGMAGYDARCYYVTTLPAMHAGLQLSYAFHSSRIFGFRIAATLDRHQAAFHKFNYTDSYSVMDVEGEPFQVDYSIAYLSENYTTWSVGIPVQLALSHKHFYLYFGPKIVLPFSCRWTESAQNAALSVYFPLQDNRVYNSFPLAASPSFHESQKGHLIPHFQYCFAAELGYDIPLHTSFHTRSHTSHTSHTSFHTRYSRTRSYLSQTTSYLSIGFYFEYSFTPLPVAPSDRISLLMLSPTQEGFPLHRLLTPVLSAQRQGLPLVVSPRPFVFGIKLSYRLSPDNSRSSSLHPCRCSEF